MFGLGSLVRRRHEYVVSNWTFVRNPSMGLCFGMEVQANRHKSFEIP